MAEMLGVSHQSVSKWERGDTYPDIALLPALANLFKASIDAIIGMDRINANEARTAIFKSGHECLRNGNRLAATHIFSEALKIFPGDESPMSELALVLSMESDPAALKQAANLCERVLSGNPSEKVRHTTNAVVCFIYYKLGETDKAIFAASNLPHQRESREPIIEALKNAACVDDVDRYLRLITLGSCHP